MLKRISSIIIALMFLLSAVKTVNAQGDTNYPIYIVQPGETLTEIAEKFKISLNELISANNIVDSNLISEGTQLIIPGIEGVSGVLTTTPVEFGESLPILLRRYAISQQNFQLLNDITSPSELYVGSSLILPENDAENTANNSITLSEDDSILEAALRNNLNPWYLSKSNQIAGLQALPEDILFFYSAEKEGFHSPVSDLISGIELSPLPIVQGHTSVVRIYTDEPTTISGSMGGYILNFFHDDEQQFYYALQGIHALAQPGLINLVINGQFENGQSFSIDQMVLLESGGYPNEELTVEDIMIDEELNLKESAEVSEILKPINDEKMWDGPFRYPVLGSLEDNTMAFSSYFGSRRSYNGGQYYGFHGGLDFTIVVNNLDIYAPAPGIVAFTGEQTIRGNTVFINHGQGIYTGYAHMKEIQVNVGDRVETGQVIGQIGKTGRVTGPHLHWDVWVNGNSVDPFDWIDNTYP